MVRRSVILLTVLLVLTGAVVTRAQPQINGLGDADLALLTSSIRDADSLHFDMTLRIDGDPGLTGGLALDGPGAVGTDDTGRPLIMLELDGLFDPEGRYEVPVFGWLRLVDNSLYMRVADDEYWRVVPSTELEEFLAASGLPTALSEMVGVQAHDFPGWLETFGLDAFASAMRLEDSAGQAHFRIEVHAGAWLLSPTFSDLMRVAGEASGEASLALLALELATALENTLLTIESAIELDSGLMHRLVLDLDILMDATLLPGSGSRDESLEGSLLLILDNLRYDGSLTVVAPEEEDTRPA